MFMIAVSFLGVMFGLALTLTAIDKIKSYKADNKSVWADGDTVRIRLNDAANPKQEDNFMRRLA